MWRGWNMVTQFTFSEIQIKEVSDKANSFKILRENYNYTSIINLIHFEDKIHMQDRKKLLCRKINVYFE